MKETIAIEDYISFPEISEDSGQSANTVFNWWKYHRYFESRKFFGSRVVHRDEYERFKREHPELLKTAVAQN